MVNIKVTPLLKGYTLHCMDKDMIITKVKTWLVVSPDFSTVIQCQWLMTSRSECIENSSFSIN